MTTIYVTNAGTIPVHVDGLWIDMGYGGDHPYGDITTDPDKLLDLAGMELIGWAITINDDPVAAGTKGVYTGLPTEFDNAATELGLNTFGAFYAALTDGKIVQLHEGDSLDIHLLWHFQQYMEEDAAFKFAIDVRFTQWNLAGDWPE